MLIEEEYTVWQLTCVLRIGSSSEYNPPIVNSHNFNGGGELFCTVFSNGSPSPSPKIRQVGRVPFSTLGKKNLYKERRGEER